MRMNQDDQKSTFRRGLMPLLLLRLLRERDMYGYELVEEISRRTGGQVQTMEGSMYPVLYKLEDAGYVSEKRVPAGKRMTRIYYHLEEAGERRGAELEEEYRATVAGVMQLLEWEPEFAPGEAPPQRVDRRRKNTLALAEG